MRISNKEPQEQTLLENTVEIAINTTVIWFYRLKIQTIKMA